jgi:hypothetical protein
MDESFAPMTVGLGPALEAKALREQNRVLREVAKASASETARATARIAEQNRRLMDNQFGVALQSYRSALDTFIKPGGVFDARRLPNYGASFKPPPGLDLYYGKSPLAWLDRGTPLRGLRDIHKPPRPLSLHSFASHGVGAIGALNHADLAQLRNAMGRWRGLDNGRAYERLALAYARSRARRINGNLSSRARAALQWGLRNWGRFLGLMRLAGAGARFLAAPAAGVVGRPRCFGRLPSALCHLAFSIQRHGPPLCLA